jgi:hypothetical protein
VLDAKASVEKSSTTHDHAGAEEMNTTAKLSAFLAGLLVGIFATAYKYHGATIDAYLHTSHLHVTDWLLLIFGSLFVGGVAYSFLQQPDTFDWRGSFWFIMGGVMIYAALGGDPGLKEAACQILNNRHHGVWSSPCYQ